MRWSDRADCHNLHARLILLDPERLGPDQEPRPLGPSAEPVSTLAAGSICQDPRDKVYARLGLADWEGGKSIVPDYGCSMLDLALDILTYMSQRYVVKAVQRRRAQFGHSLEIVRDVIAVLGILEHIRQIQRLLLDRLDHSSVASRNSNTPPYLGAQGRQDLVDLPGHLCSKLCAHKQDITALTSCLPGVKRTPARAFAGSISIRTNSVDHRLLTSLGSYR